MTAHTLILLRHGETDWNQKNLFTGWVDVDLTEKGRAEAVRGGQPDGGAGLLPDVVHTSVLRRAITTANLALDAADRHWIPVRRSWRLNERHYGALQGLDKAETRDKYGDEQFMLWRRSFDTPPPPIEAGSEFDQTGDPRYAGVDGAAAPSASRTSSPRMMPYWENDDPGRPAAPARRCSSPPTATRCARWSSTSTASATTTSPGSTSPPACRWSTGSATTSCRPARASTSTRRPLRPLPPRSRTRAADRRSTPVPSAHPRPEVARVAAAEQRLPPAEPPARAGPR